MKLYITILFGRTFSLQKPDACYNGAMKGRIERVKSIVQQGLEPQDNIESAALVLQQDMDIYDPYFLLSFDVYYKGDLPEERASLFQGLEMFESSPAAQKDRLLIDNLPVRIYYRKVDDINTLCNAQKTGGHYSPRELSFLIHRTDLADVLFDKNGWYSGLLKELENPDESFWIKLRDYYSMKMENYLNDLRAASMRQDLFFFHLSLGNFLRNSGAMLMSIHKITEPSPRYFDRYMKRLTHLPDGFEANYSSLLRTDEELTMERKSEVAALFTRSILGLIPS